MGQLFLYNDHNSSLNTDELRLTNVWQNWGYIWHCSGEEARNALDSVCTDHGTPIGSWEDIAETVLDLFEDDSDFFELFVELTPSYTLAEARAIAVAAETNRQEIIDKMVSEWSKQGFNGTDKYFGDDYGVQLNEDAPPSPWVMAAGAGVVLAFTIKTVVSEYKKAKAKALKEGKKVDTKKLILSALSAAANEVQRAKA
jgi:hypothetical protein